MTLTQTDTQRDPVITGMLTMMMFAIGGLLILEVMNRMPNASAQSQSTPQQTPYGSWFFGPLGYILNMDYLSEDSSAPLYVGEAVPGTRNDEPGWRIYKYEYVIIDDDYEPSGIRYASGNTNFDKIWDNRAEYEYS